MWRGSLAFYENQLGSGKVTYPNKAVREYASDWTAQSATRTGQRFTRMREYTTWQWPDRTKGPPSILVSRVGSDSNKSSIISSMSRKAHALLLDRKPYILLVRDFLNLSMRWFHQQWKWLPSPISFFLSWNLNPLSLSVFLSCSEQENFSARLESY